MPKSILVDLNVILDVLLERSGYEASLKVLESQSKADHALFISGHTVTTFAYLLENAKVTGNEISRHIDWLLKTFSVVAITDDILADALQSKVTDYEDAAIEQAALRCEAVVIVTRNIKDFRRSSVPAITPENLVD